MSVPNVELSSVNVVRGQAIIYKGSPALNYGKWTHLIMFGSFLQVSEEERQAKYSDSDSCKMNKSSAKT